MLTSINRYISNKYLQLHLCCYMKLKLSYEDLRNLAYLQVVYTMVVITDFIYIYTHYISSKFLNLFNFKRSESPFEAVPR